jgi:hypothetical protein
MSIADLKRELRTLERLIDTMSTDAAFAEDLACLEKTRKALATRLLAERKKHRRRRVRIAVAA